MIELNQLSFFYRRQKPLFREMSFSLMPGRIIGLLGKNGAGKTTLLHLMGGLLEPREGTIDVNGFRPFDRQPEFLSDVYLVPEEFSFPHSTISTYIKSFSVFYPSFDNVKMDALLTEFQLEHDMQLNSISHGQRKKFLIACALASNCKLLMFDEPTNGLDIPSKSQFRKILVSSVSDEQVVIMSTHQVKDIDTIIDTVMVIDEGKVIYQKTTEAITACLYFERTDTLDPAKVLYFESGIGGYRCIRRGDGKHESPIDLELLFNAIINPSIHDQL